MQNINSNDNDITNDENTQDLSQKDDLPQKGQTTVVSQTALDYSGKESNNSQFTFPNNITPLKTVTKIDDNTGFKNETLHRRNIKKAKARKNLRAKKRKKTPEEKAILEAYFDKDPTWGRKTVKALKGELPNLTVDQIYKWGYDHKLLLKSLKNKEKNAKLTNKQKPSIQEEEVLKEKSILDFNLEVEELLKSEIDMSEELVGDSPVATASDTTAPPTRRNSHLGSLDGKETLPTSAEADVAVVEDDPFFYERKDEAVFYVVINGSSKAIPQRRAGKRGLFRVPSGFVNMDFYTYKEGAFEPEGGATFLGELFKDD